METIKNEFGEDTLLPPELPGNYPEHFHLDNGCYQNKCVDCGELYYGPKRSVVCKVCKTKQDLNKCSVEDCDCHKSNVQILTEYFNSKKCEKQSSSS